jgi:hypothetical protein
MRVELWCSTTGLRDTSRYSARMLVAAEVPNTADWMQGWGAVISLPLSLLAVLFTGRLLRHEIRARREERADLESRQARLVRVQIDRDLDKNAATYSFIVHNLSPASIYDVRVFRVSQGQYAAEGDGPLVRELRSGDQVSTSLGPRWFDNGTRLVPLSPLAGIQFDDADGRAWIRYEDEQPRRWTGPGLFSHESTRELVVDYLSTFRPMRALFGLKFTMRSKFRDNLMRRTQYRQLPHSDQ